MRYLAQFLVPALILVLVVYLVGRTRSSRSGAEADDGPSSDSGTVILIVVVGAALAVLSFILLQAALS